MKAEKPEKIDYPYIRAWGILMGSYQYYIDGQVERARKENAPQNAIYLISTGQWAVFTDIVAEDVRDFVDKTAKEIGGAT